MAINAIGAAAITEIGSEVLKRIFSKAGGLIENKIIDNFGGENNPIDEKMDMKSSSLMAAEKRTVWDEINHRINDNGGEGFFARRDRRKMATKRRMNFAAMMDEAPTVKTEELNDKGKVTKTTYPPLPDFKPLATKVKEYCVDIFLAEQKAQADAGKDAQEAANIAQEKVEIYLRDAGFPVASSKNPYRSADEFLVKLPVHLVSAGTQAKKIINAKVTQVDRWVQREYAKLPTDQTTTGIASDSPRQRARARR